MEKVAEGNSPCLYKCEINETEEEEDVDQIQDEIVEVDLYSLCRICGNMHDTLIPIYADQGLELELSTKINYYLPIDVGEEDILPLKVCSNCATTVAFWHEFIAECCEAEKRFSIMLQSSMMEDNKGEIEIGPDTLQEEINEVDNSADDENQTMDTETQGTEYLEETEYANDESIAERLPLDEALEEPSTELESTPEQDAEEQTKPNKSPDTTITRTRRSKIISTVEISPKTPYLLDPTDSATFDELVKKSNRSGNMRLSNEILDEIRLNLKLEDDGLYKCYECEFDTDQRDVMEGHLRQHFQTTLKKLKQTMKLKAKFFDENKVEIDGKTLYECPECNKRLHATSTFLWHMRIHTGEKPYVCYICGKKFRVYHGISRHIKETHMKTKDFACDICGRLFSNRRNVAEHRNLHSNERPYTCDTCGKGFKQQASLFMHKRLHQPHQYKCEECGLGFRIKSSLLVHATVHTGVKDHECDVCQKRFRIKHELNLHKLVHTDFKPFACEKCGQSFKQKRYLIRHKKNRGH